MLHGNSTNLRLIRAKEVAQMLGISRQQVYRMAASGQLPSVFVTDRSVRFRPESIEEWIREREHQRDNRAAG